MIAGPQNTNTSVHKVQLDQVEGAPLLNAQTVLIGYEESANPTEDAFAVVDVHTLRRLGLFLCVKRFLDLIVSLLVLILGLPLWLLIAVVIKLESKGPVLYVAPRLGYRERQFSCYKFRSMIVDADDLKQRLRHLNYREGAFFKIENDPRITRFGRFLRATSMDEMPQLLNILRGEMSLVGPRPHPLDDCSKYSSRDKKRLSVVPGLTGFWQVHGRKDPSFERSISMDLEYIRRWSLWLDLKLLLQTVPAVLFRDGE